MIIVYYSSLLLECKLCEGRTFVGSADVSQVPAVVPTGLTSAPWMFADWQSAPIHSLSLPSLGLLVLL